MIQKKSLINTIKKALQTGTFNYMGQEAKQIPTELFNIDTIQFDDANWWECVPIVRVDISNNEIEALPEEWANLPDLQLLRAKDNRVELIPRNVLLLETIKSLDFSRNRIKDLPEQISFNRTLVELNFSENSLELIPSLAGIDSLEHVYFNDNRLKCLPNFGVKIKKIEASNNKITEITRANFQKSGQLESLNLNKNQIQIIEKGAFANTSSMVLLELKENRLKEFQEIPKSDRLDTINIAYNNIQEYNHFANCPNLTVLILSNNKIKSISREIILMKSLKTLDLENNDLPELPCEIGFINSLVRLQVEGNPLKSIRQNIRNGGTNVLKKYLKDKMAPEEREALENRLATSFEQKGSEKEFWHKLLIEFNQGGELMLKSLKLTEIDPVVFKAENIKGLNISDNQVSEVPEDIAGFHSLKYLVANKNVLERLPVYLGTLPYLESIEAKNNKISGFGSNQNNSLNKYRSLRHLDLSANRFTEIPKPILWLENLRTLYLSYNKISSVDKVWSPQNLPRLQVLDVSNNSLSELSDGVYEKVRTLNFLNVENNNLAKLPTLLGFMKLSSLKVDGNPLKLIKRTVIEKGSIALLEFLRTKHVGPIPEAVESPIEQKIEGDETYDTNPYQQSPPISKHKKEFIPEEIYPEQRELKPNSREIEERVKQIDTQIKAIQIELETNYSINTMMKNQLKRRMQCLQIERNKILK